MEASCKVSTLLDMSHLWFSLPKVPTGRKISTTKGRMKPQEMTVRLLTMTTVMGGICSPHPCSQRIALREKQISCTVRSIYATRPLVCPVFPEYRQVFVIKCRRPHSLWPCNTWNPEEQATLVTCFHIKYIKNQTYLPSLCYTSDIPKDCHYHRLTFVITILVRSPNEAIRISEKVVQCCDLLLLDKIRINKRCDKGTDKLTMPS